MFTYKLPLRQVFHKIKGYTLEIVYFQNNLKNSSNSICLVQLGIPNTKQERKSLQDVLGSVSIK